MGARIGPRIIVSVSRADKEAAFNVHRFRTSVRVRLPRSFRFEREPEFVSVTKEQFDTPANESRARELFNLIERYVREAEGNMSGWRAALRDERVRDIRTTTSRHFLWKQMMILTILDHRNRLEAYFDGADPIEEAFASILELRFDPHALIAEFGKNLLDGFLDPVSQDLAMALAYEDAIRVGRLADNGAVASAYMQAFFALLGILEGLPTSGAVLMEGGIGGGVGAANFAFSATVAFTSYLQALGEFNADGVITKEEEDSLARNFILIPVLCMLGIPLLPRLGQRLADLTLTGLDILDKLERAVEGIEVLIDYLGLMEQLEQEGTEDGLAFDEESAIVIPNL